MKDNFEESMKHVFVSEGGYGEHPHDPGGATKYGITIGVWHKWVGRPVTKAEMRALTKEQVLPLYRKEYWDAVRADELPTGLDYLLFDFGVNAGPTQAIRTLQRCLGVTADGIFGPKTMAAIQAATPDDLIERFSDAKEAFYRSLSTFEYFGKGWLNRVEHVKEIASKMA
jgi:lysozyme family protein